MGIREGSRLKAEARDDFPEEETEQRRGQGYPFWGWLLHFKV